MIIVSILNTIILTNIDSYDSYNVMSNTEQDIVANKGHFKRKYNPIDYTKLLKLYFVQGLEQSEIARLMGVPRQTISTALKPYKQLISNPDRARAYCNNRSMIFDALESELVALAQDKTKHKKATLGNVAYALDKVYQINRLEQGKSTSNVQVIDLTPQERELLRKYDSIDTVPNNDNIQGIDNNSTYDSNIDTG